MIPCKLFVSFNKRLDLIIPNKNCVFQHLLRSGKSSFLLSGPESKSYPLDLGTLHQILATFLVWQKSRFLTSSGFPILK